MIPAAVAESELAAAPLDLLPIAVLLLDAALIVRVANAAAESLLQQSRGQICGAGLAALTAADSPLLALTETARREKSVLSEHDLALSGPRFRVAHAAIDVAPLAAPAGWTALCIKDRSLERRLERQAHGVDAARAAEGLAAMLAHEVKNPLSGIRGAAQLLEARVAPAERRLAQLIREETDRIVALVDDLEIFTGRPLTPMQPVNIHEVLERVRFAAAAGFANHVRFLENYDPSLPAVLGNSERLIQVLLNLVKNAAEACPAAGGVIQLGTQYRPGLTRVGAARKRLGLVVSVQDNGAGVPDAVRERLFEAFVSGRAGGKGLGLALAAKFIADHDGSIEFESVPGRTVFSVLLPLAEEAVVAA